jgi:hypothetical protein
MVLAVADLKVIEAQVLQNLKYSIYSTTSHLTASIQHIPFASSFINHLQRPAQWLTEFTPILSLIKTTAASLALSLPHVLIAEDIRARESFHPTSPVRSFTHTL